MHNYANATVEGFVVFDPSFKKTKNGKSVCTFQLAINHCSKEDKPPRVSFIDVETWEKVADFCNQNITKGDKILVIGSLRQDRWEDNKGKIQSRIKIVANEILFIKDKIKED